MRFTSISSPIILLHILFWLLATASPSIAQVEESVEAADRLISSNDPLHRLAHTLRPKRVKTVVKKAPKKLRLGTDDFLHSGLKRKAIVGAYSTTAAVGLGGAAVWYQLTNLRSKERDANAKAASEYLEPRAEQRRRRTALTSLPLEVHRGSSDESGHLCSPATQSSDGGPRCHAGHFAT